MKAFIIFRDRVSYGTRCFEAMASAGLQPVLVDHGSTYPEAVEWVAELEKSGVPVIRRRHGNPRDLWNYPEFRELCGSERYVVTDPDVVPSEGVPPDWPEFLCGVLDRIPAFRKAGLGLRLDRIPEHYARRDQVLQWEQKYWDTPLTDGPQRIIYAADVDTTLAMHEPLQVQWEHTLTAVRTGFPYVADHLSWYENFDNLPPDLAWYHEHAESGISFWTTPGRSCYWKD